MMERNEYGVVATDYRHMDLAFEPGHQLVWARFKYPGLPCMSKGLLEDVARAQDVVVQQAKAGCRRDDPNRLIYQVLCSSMPGVFNLGGDLAYFMELIHTGNRNALAEYATSCIDILYRSAVSYDLPFTTIALVQGEALGGGFEAALSANTLIAEKGARFGFPETVFGLFPGMGAFSFLARRLSPALAKRLIAKGKLYTAEELYDMGVVDVLVDDGRGKEAVYEYIEHRRGRNAGYQGLERIMDQYHPLPYSELREAADVWVDTAMKLSDRNLRMVQYLLGAQQRRFEPYAPEVSRVRAV